MHEKRTGSGPERAAWQYGTSGEGDFEKVWPMGRWNGTLVWSGRGVPEGE